MNTNILKTGDIVLYDTKLSLNPVSWLDWCIRKITHSNYNHAGIIINNWGELFLNEAVGTGIITQPLENRLNGTFEILRSNKEFNEKDLATKANSKLGIKYDFISLFFYQLIYQLFRIWIGRTEKAATKRMYCSEYVAWCLDESKFWEITPADFDASGKYIGIYKTIGL